MKHPGAVLLGVVHLGQRSIKALGCRHGANRGDRGRRCSGMTAVADNKAPCTLADELGKPVVDTTLDVDAVRVDAELAGVAPLEARESIGRLVEIGIVKHQERAVATELQRDLLQPIGAHPCHEFPHAGLWHASVQVETKYTSRSSSQIR